tara:strand:- start:593 stop:853 length:261 start_codon:yes stop_codon:yes gene_type:complete
MYSDNMDTMMEMKIRYGNTIHSDNTINKTIQYSFDSLWLLQLFWKDRKTIQETSGSWTASISELQISFSYYVDSEEYFKSIAGEEE